MKREDLFLAIGEVEESRLARSEWNVSSGRFKEEKPMKTRPTHVIRNILAAAMVVTLLATTAFAATGFILYDNPLAMLNAFFGTVRKPHGPDCACAECRAIEPSFEREELNEELAEEAVAPNIIEVGETLIYEDTGLKYTVDAYLYDENTGCGLVYYTMERTEDRAQYPIDYKLEADGEIWQIPTPLDQDCKMYLIQEESTPYTLKIAAYYIQSGQLGGNYLKFALSDGQEITLSYENIGKMNSLTLAEGKIILSPIGLAIYQGIGVPAASSHDMNFHQVVIRYQDGTEYLVKNSADGNLTMNFGYALIDTDKLTYALNRLVDVDNVASVIIDGVEFPVT